MKCAQKERRRGWCIAAGLVALVVAFTACDDTSAGPGAQPGTITATLASPNGAEGAVLVEIAGPVSRVTQVTGQMFSAKNGSATQILVVMDEAGVVRFDLGLSDIQSPPEYRILQVSGPDDELRNDLGGYALEFTP